MKDPNFILLEALDFYSKEPNGERAQAALKEFLEDTNTCKFDHNRDGNCHLCYNRGGCFKKQPIYVCAKDLDSIMHFGVRNRITRNIWPVLTNTSIWGLNQNMIAGKVLYLLNNAADNIHSIGVGRLWKQMNGVLRVLKEGYMQISEETGIVEEAC